ncbi:MAG: hypothetical protein JRJ47_05085 [Deltaproteobacteria bacterium]|nr:hypothetical protein [Deltaproteobacteria bacterium]
MRRVGCVVLSLVFYLFLVGMGGVGNPGSVQVPKTEANYSATIVDLSDLATRVEKFSFDGQTYLSGKMGDADVSITLDRVKSITFVLHEDTLTAEVELKDGKTARVVMDKKTACYGQFAYGGYKIAVVNIKLVKVHGEVLP